MSAPATGKKVLHIGKYFPPHAGGMETYLYDLMHALAKLDITPSALVHQSKTSLTSVEESVSANGAACCKGGYLVPITLYTHQPRFPVGVAPVHQARSA